MNSINTNYLVKTMKLFYTQFNFYNLKNQTHKVILSPINQTIFKNLLLYCLNYHIILNLDFTKFKLFFVNNLLTLKDNITLTNGLKDLSNLTLSNINHYDLVLQTNFNHTKKLVPLTLNYFNLICNRLLDLLILKKCLTHSQVILIKESVNKKESKFKNLNNFNYNFYNAKIVWNNLDTLKWKWFKKLPLNLQHLINLRNECKINLNTFLNNDSVIKLYSILSNLPTKILSKVKRFRLSGYSIVSYDKLNSILKHSTFKFNELLTYSNFKCNSFFFMVQQKKKKITHLTNLTSHFVYHLLNYLLYYYFQYEYLKYSIFKKIMKLKTSFLKKYIDNDLTMIKNHKKHYLKHLTNLNTYIYSTSLYNLCAKKDSNLKSWWDNLN